MSDVDAVKPCSRTKCFVHDGETCADGHMRREDCPRWREPRLPAKPQPYTRAQVDEIRARVDPTGPLAGDGETVRSLLATIAARDEEIARLREELRLALVANEDQRTAILAERARCLAEVSSLGNEIPLLGDAWDEAIEAARQKIASLG